MDVPRPPDEALRTPVSDLIAFLGRPHMHTVIFHATAVQDGAIRFNPLLAATNVPRNTLVQRLKDLVRAGLLERHEYAEVPLRVEYEATEKFVDLVPVFVKMHEWGKNHALVAP